jgi:hypothetical protein
MSNEPVAEPQPYMASARIEWNFPPGMQSRYATLFAAQPTTHEITISFFEPQIPVLVGTPEEIATQAQEITSIRAECVGRIVVAAEQMPELIAVLQNSLKMYHGARAQQTEPTDQAESKGAQR